MERSLTRYHMHSRMWGGVGMSDRDGHSGRGEGSPEVACGGIRTRETQVEGVIWENRLNKIDVVRHKHTVSFEV